MGGIESTSPFKQGQNSQKYPKEKQGQMSPGIFIPHYLFYDFGTHYWKPKYFIIEKIFSEISSMPEQNENDYKIVETQMVWTVGGGDKSGILTEMV